MNRTLLTVFPLVLWACGNRAAEVTPATSSEAKRVAKATSVAKPVEKNFSALALGESHSCALHDSGRVFCWGGNQSWQVGNASLGDIVPVPTAVPGIEDAVQIVATGDTTCTRTAAGEVWCWGRRATPKRVEGLVKPAMDIVICEGHFGYYGCSQHEGEVSCWGDQIFESPDGKPLLPSKSAVAIPDLHDATGLACQREIACASRGPKDALCWGAVEDDSMMATSAYIPPVPLPAFHKKQSQVSSAATMSSCRDGACWSLAPDKGEDTFPLKGIQTVAHGDHMTCKLLNGGQVTCEGSNDFGMQGEADKSGALLGIRASVLAVGGSHACVLDKERGIVCWGDNVRGQLGDGKWGQSVPAPQKLTELSQPSDLKASRRWVDWPTRSVMLSSLSPVEQERLQRLHNWQWRGVAVTKEQQLVWWGGTRPAKITSKSPSMTKIDLNGEELCASTKEGLVCAALSDGDLAWKRVSAQQFDQISAGGHHFCGRDDAGFAWCWGSSEKGAIGDGGNTDRSTPVRVQGLAKIAKVGSGDAHSCALDLDGKVWCWGKNNQGRLGDGTTSERRAPVAVSGLDDAVDLSVGKDTSCAVREDGVVSCWGRRFTGASFGLQAVPVDAASKISVGCDHACSLSDTGTVQCWGDNEHGQLGAVPGTLQPNPAGKSKGTLWARPYLGPSTVAGLPPATRIVAGCNGTCAETTTGEVYCWGHRSSLGLGEESFRSKAKPIADPKTGWPQLPSDHAK